jgi:hypothetical protein
MLQTLSDETKTACPNWTWKQSMTKCITARDVTVTKVISLGYWEYCTMWNRQDTVLTDMVKRTARDPTPNASSSKHRVNISVIRHLSTSIILGKLTYSTKTSRCRRIYDNLLGKLIFLQRTSSLPLLIENLRIQINRRMCSKSVSKDKGGRAQENYPRLEGGMRDWDATSVRQGVTGRARDGNRDQYSTQTSFRRP